MINLSKYKVSTGLSIRNAVTKMDEAGLGFCVCVDDQDRVIGVMTDGDFRRAIHNGIQLDENVTKVINRKFYSVNKNFTNSEVENIFNTTIVESIPVLDKRKLIDIITLDKFFKANKEKKRRSLKSTVVIMAGGKGTRLDPFTRILPKPLLPLGNDPVIKVIMDEFNKFGMDHFYISLNDKQKMIKAYFHDHNLDYKIDFLSEDKPLGTAGALKYLEGKIKNTFFVSNCDVIVRTDYGSFLDFHKSGKYALTMVGSMRQYTIPYGVCETNQTGVLKTIHEKPQYDLLVNTGLYLMEPLALEYIPQNKEFNMTDLIRKLQEAKLMVGIFPVSEKSWIDVGQLSEYREIVKQLSLLE
jgi:dTDP-glucose pyrophosphorylase